MKTKLQIFNWLIRNCQYYDDPTTDAEVDKMVRVYKKDKIPLQVAVNYIRPFHAELKAFEKFVGGKYSFAKHIRPIHEMGLISVTMPPKEYDTPEYRKIFNDTSGLVEDYDTGISYVCFWLGEYDRENL